MTLKSAC
ncbi:unnamed protein product, partial [Allacma fusca]